MKFYLVLLILSLASFSSAQASPSKSKRTPSSDLGTLECNAKFSRKAAEGDDFSTSDVKSSPFIITNGSHFARSNVVIPHFDTKPGEKSLGTDAIKIEYVLELDISQESVLDGQFTLSLVDMSGKETPMVSVKQKPKRGKNMKFTTPTLLNYPDNRLTWFKTAYAQCELKIN